ncbi:MAG: hypothetical protein JRN52_15410 [Nitrososphaerota archaeon]|nr:hypothetical protein [Nitrososphaerota archaeon]
MSFAKQSQLQVINTLGVELPDWFDKDDYVLRTQKRLEAFLSEEGDLSSALQEIEKQQLIFEDTNSVKLFRDAITLLGDKMKTWYRAYENYSAKLLLESDISVDYFLLTKDAELAQISSFEIYSHKLKELDTRLSIKEIHNNFLKFSQAADKFKSDLSPLLTLGRVLSDSLSKLNLYLDLQNSSSIDEMFEFTPYLKNHMYAAAFDQFIQELEISLTRMNEELVLRQGYVHKPLELSDNTKRLKEDLANLVLA